MAVPTPIEIANLSSHFSVICSLNFRFIEFTFSTPTGKDTCTQFAHLEKQIKWEELWNFFAIRVYYI